MRPLLDFATLLSPIPGDDPSGSPVPYPTREWLEAARKEDNPDDYPPDDPEREKLRKADWKGIVARAQDTLTQVSKDLLVAARLTEALVRLHGFAGMRDGLRLLREMVEQCWERLQPPIEDGDLDRRATPFHWLDAPDTGARLPNVLRLTPLLIGKDGAYSTIAIRGVPPFQQPANDQEVEKALQATPEEDCARVAEELTQCREELDKLTADLTQRMGEAAPGLTALRQAVEDCAVLAQDILRRKGAVETVGGDGSRKEKEQPVPAPANGAPGSRAEAYRQLEQAAALLRRLEPHSPIPYLVQRAVELGALPFPQLIKALIRDAAVLGELNRELGLKEPPPPPPD
jgi:type VI secretion system protein ImpA